MEWVCLPTAVRGLGAPETFHSEPSLSASHYHEWGVRSWLSCCGMLGLCEADSPSRLGPPGSLPAPSCMFSRVPNLDGQEDPGQQVAVSCARTASFQQLWQTVKSLGSCTWCLSVSSSVKYDRYSFWCLYWSAMATGGLAVSSPYSSLRNEQISSMRKTENLYCDNKTKRNTQKALCKHSFSLPLFQH